MDKTIINAAVAETLSLRASRPKSMRPKTRSVRVRSDQAVIAKRRAVVDQKTMLTVVHEILENFLAGKPQSPIPDSDVVVYPQPREFTYIQVRLNTLLKIKAVAKQHGVQAPILVGQILAASGRK